jgi:uncharacterized protein (DUF924 family)
VNVCCKDIEIRVGKDALASQVFRCWDHLINLIDISSHTSMDCDIKPDDVLDYWFSGDWQANYNSKWFASGETQRVVDAEIYSRFLRLYELALAGKLDTWMEGAVLDHVAYIIVLDQFSRHIRRCDGYSKSEEHQARADALALKAAEVLISKPFWSRELSIPHYVFSLMPFRHNASIPRLREVLRHIDDRERSETESLELIHKFRKQTIRRLQHLEDRSVATESEDILERHHFEADESNIMKEPLVLAVEGFLKRHADLSPQQTYHKCLAISLSGGVDSMVIAKILTVLRNKYQAIYSIVAIHIDYANREESGLEADYVGKWCEQMSVSFRKRVINEVTRGITDRAVYERVARDIRYGFYQEVLHETNCPAVMFGHHLGDVQENVMSNIMR